MSFFKRTNQVYKNQNWPIIWKDCWYRCWFSVLPLTCREFSRFSKCFLGIIQIFIPLFLCHLCCGFSHSFVPVGVSCSPPAGHSLADNASAPDERLWQQQQGSPDWLQYPPAPHLHTGGCAGHHENQSRPSHITQHQVTPPPGRVTFCRTSVPPATCKTSYYSLYTKEKLCSAYSLPCCGEQCFFQLGPGC